jgi:hypothetical protein
VTPKVSGWCDVFLQPGRLSLSAEPAGIFVEGGVVNAGLYRCRAEVRCQQNFAAPLECWCQARHKAAQIQSEAVVQFAGRHRIGQHIRKGLPQIVFERLVDAYLPPLRT